MLGRNTLTEADVRAVKNNFPPGLHVQLIHMNDKQAPPVGTKGTVNHVDDIGTIHVRWENGSGLGLVMGQDSFRILYEK